MRQERTMGHGDVPARPSTDEHLRPLAETVAGAAFTLPADVVLHAVIGDQPGRSYLAPFLPAEELDAATRRHRDAKRSPSTEETGRRARRTAPTRAAESPD
jgi:hypothetical protein